MDDIFLFSRATIHDMQQNIASFINMLVVTDLGKNFGMPLLIKRKTTSAFQPFLDKIKNGIRARHTKLISQAGRVTLIKPVLAPAHLLSNANYDSS